MTESMAVRRAQLRVVALHITAVHDLLTAFADEFAPFPDELIPAHTRDLAALRHLLGHSGAGGPGTHRSTSPAPACRVAGRATALRLIATALRDTATALESLLREPVTPDLRDDCLRLRLSTLHQLSIVQSWLAR